MTDVDNKRGTLDNLSEDTLLAIHHLQSSMMTEARIPKSQLDQALDQMSRNAGFPPTSADDPTEVDGRTAKAAEPEEAHSLPASKIHKEDASAPGYRRLVSRFRRGRRVFRTEKSYFGNGMRTVEVGDQVWLLAGAIVLRPLENGRYSLVGDAYVHGIMHGEAWYGKDFLLQDVELE